MKMMRTAPWCIFVSVNLPKMDNNTKDGRKYHLPSLVIPKMEGNVAVVRAMMRLTLMRVRARAP